MLAVLPDKLLSCSWKPLERVIGMCIHTHIYIYTYNASSMLKFGGIAFFTEGFPSQGSVCKPLAASDSSSFGHKMHVFDII